MIRLVGTVDVWSMLLPITNLVGRHVVGSRLLPITRLVGRLVVTSTPPSMTRLVGCCMTRLVGRLFDASSIVGLVAPVTIKLVRHLVVWTVLVVEVLMN